eukprot:TRINITY_DN33139_c0_g1_i1.p1 TRINITY_DN33139_c0_g1~~TRINITY_DN33139_c0_g1_i1.p1  ORF type:complete len:688 (-),score=88.75 TRINITY_DN33139_c0_g1_i1:143-2083(-)
MTAMACDGHCRAVDQTHVEVLFNVQAYTQPGETVVVVGSHPTLGGWRPASALVLSTHAGQFPRWSGKVSLPKHVFVENTIAFKYAVLQAGSERWEEGDNRRLLPLAITDAQATFGDVAGASGAVPSTGVALPSPSLPTPLPPALGEGLDVTPDTEDSLSPSEDVKSTLQVTFIVVTDLRDGEKVVVVGGHQSIGNWSLCSSVELAPYEGATSQSAAPKYTATVGISAEESGSMIEFKYVILSPGRDPRWEPGQNRALHLESKKTFEAAAFGAMSGAPGVSVQVPDVQGFETASFSTRIPGCDSLATISSDVLLEDTPVVEARHFAATAVRRKKDMGPCEDAYFYSKGSLGLADGVGSMVIFKQFGVDSARYAQDLMQLAAFALKDTKRTQSPRLPRSVSSSSSNKARDALGFAAEKATTFGASTMCIVSMEGTSCEVANLGDSGFTLLRSQPWGYWKVIESSFEQCHRWNMPYQLTRVPPAVMERVRGRKIHFDSAQLSNVYSFEVLPGDLLLVYSDGLTDNLSTLETLRIVGENADPEQGHRTPGLSADAVANALVDAAYKNSRDPECESPFWKNARAHREECSLGGKPDDITVIAAYIMDGDGATSGSSTHSHEQFATVSSPPLSEDVNFISEVEIDLSTLQID